MSVAYRSTSRPTIGQPLSVDISTDIAVECRSICRPIYRSRGAQNTYDPYIVTKSIRNGSSQSSQQRNDCSLTLKANVLVEDIDCEQSLFCSKIRGEERKEERNTSERWVVSVRACYATRATYGLLVTHAVTIVLLSSLRSSPRISEQRKDCSQSIEDTKISNV